MKTANKSAESTKNFDQLISILNVDEILNIEALSCIRGGSAEGEANGGSPVIIIPKKEC
jgi:hypothetical protein